MFLLKLFIMKKIKVFLVLICLIQSFLIIAQTDSFTYKKNIWTEGFQDRTSSVNEPIILSYFKYADADTVVAGKNYLKLIGTHFFSPNSPYSIYTLIRSEGNSKIFALSPATCTPGSMYCSAQKEALIYDFSLKTGDSISNYLKNDNYGNRTIVSKITKIDSVFIFGKNRKRFAVNYSDSGKQKASDYWVEGIGSLTHPLYPLTPYRPFEAGIWLTCFQGMSDPHCLTGVEDNFSVSKIEIFPNPTNNLIQINFNKEIGYLKKLSINDVSGKIMKNIFVQNDLLSIDVKDLPKGLYFLNLEFDTGIVTKKFVIQK